MSEQDLRDFRMGMINTNMNLILVILKSSNRVQTIKRRHGTIIRKRVDA
jgi:hypothetical protein